MQYSARSSERVIAIWGAITFGALLTSTSSLRSVRDALAIEGDPEQIPWLFTATFIAVAVVSPVWSALLARGDKRRLVPAVYHAFALCAVGFATAIAFEVAPVGLGHLFYVWHSVFTLFVVSVLWSLLADLLGPDIARRLYGPIAAGGTVGTVLGPLLTRALVGQIGVAAIVGFSVVLLELAVFSVHRVRIAGEQLVGRRPPAPTAVGGEPAGGAFDGLRHIAREPFLLAIVGYVLCTATAATLVYLEQANIAKAELPDRVARTELFASIDLAVAAATFVVQAVLAGPLLRWLGPGLVLMALPLAQGVGITTLALAPTLGVLITVQVISRTATHGLTRPARELLFTVVARDEKYHAKNAIDTIVYRAGDFGAAWLRRGLIAVGVAGGALAAAAAPLIAVWLALAALLGAGFRRRAPLAGKQPPWPAAAASSAEPSPPDTQLPAARARTRRPP